MPPSTEGRSELRFWLGRFCEHQAVIGRSARTVQTHRGHLEHFIGWAEDRSLERPGEVNIRILERYQRAVFYHRKKNGQPLAPSSQHSRLVAVRVFFRFLVKQDAIDANPAADLELPKVNKRLPKHVLTTREAEQILTLPDVTTPLGLRDRAIMEVLYSTGIRRMELVNLRLFDLDTARGTLMVRMGKGRKDRMLPIGARAMAFVGRWLDERAGFVLEPDEGTLFLTRFGEPFSPNALSRLVHEYIERAAIGKRGSCHLFRHTMATLMLEGGADVRFIQAMLGHSSLSTTEIYTQVSIKQLKAVHDAAHPAAHLKKQSEPTS